MSRAPGEQPIREKRNTVHEDYVESHPAYAQIAASRVSSTPGAHLYGSDFRHQHYMTITIRRSHLTRSLNSDRASGGEEIIEVALSEAQWATFVSTPNMGLGVQATMQYHRADGGYLPSIIPIGDRREQFSREISEDLAETITFMEEALAAAKTKAQREPIERAISRLRNGLPWVAQQFDEHAEQTIEKMKVEVNAYLTAAVQGAGLTALGGVPAPIMLEDPETLP